MEEVEHKVRGPEGSYWVEVLRDTMSDRHPEDLSKFVTHFTFIVVSSIPRKSLCYVRLTNRGTVRVPFDSHWHSGRTGIVTTITKILIRLGRENHLFVELRTN